MSKAKIKADKEKVKAVNAAENLLAAISEHDKAAKKWNKGVDKFKSFAKKNKKQMFDVDWGAKK